MRIHFFSDHTRNGERVLVVPRCVGCKTLGALLISNGEQGAIVHFDREAEVADLISELRKEPEDGAQV